MPTSSSYTLNTRVLDSLIKNTDGNVTKAIAKAAFMVEARAKIRAPVDTGALRASIYTAMARSSGANKAMSEARSRRPEAKVTALPVPRDDHVAHVGPSVEYGQAVELGSATRSGTPYLQPALRETEKDIKALLAEAVNGK